jgi:hypothetical protein
MPRRELETHQHQITIGTTASIDLPAEDRTTPVA